MGKICLLDPSQCPIVSGYEQEFAYQMLFLIYLWIAYLTFEVQATTHPPIFLGQNGIEASTVQFVLRSHILTEPPPIQMY